MATAIETMNKDAEMLEARGALYKLFSLSLRYPTAELAGHLADNLYWDKLFELCEFVGVDNMELSSLVKGDRERLKAEAAEQGVQGLEIEYNYLFQLPKETNCPLTASEYMKGEGRQALAVAQLNGIYRLFGIQMGAMESPDNVCVILEFMSWLCAKELRATLAGEADKVETCRQVQATLVEDYLGWIPLLAEVVNKNARLAYYPWVTGALVAFLRQERARLLHPAA